ncbi:MAG: CRISPR-associated endoribonuclease Cas6 [Melioribacter sp.]|nr:CRISPR-associated endoribonuclease Cas6 [Melioribacter sp.]
MRLLLKLSVNNSNKISLNYNYALSSAIYSLLKFGSPEFSSFLHQIGYKSDNKTYKLFTFTLKFESTQLTNNYLSFNSPKAYLYISSPMIDDFIKNFVIGTFEQKKIELYSDYIKTVFNIDEAELIPPPNFNENMYFKMISPMVLSTYKIIDGDNSQYFFRYDDDINEINRVFNQNLLNKYQAINNREYVGSGIKLSWDIDFAIQSLKKGKRLSKKVLINKDINNPIDVIGIFCPFNVSGDSKLTKLGYECGFGEKNSMGFGMVAA